MRRPRFPTERDLRRGRELLVADRRAGDPELSVAEALLHAHDVLWPNELVDVYDDPRDVARVREALIQLNGAPSREELVELVRLLASEDVVRLTDLQEYWVARAARGDLR